MNLPKRKSPRLKGFDYSTPGYYFITICTNGKRKTLCDVVSHTKIVRGSIVGAIHESPEIQLTAQGKIIDEIINNIPVRFNVLIDKYVIMPNHIDYL